MVKVFFDDKFQRIFSKIKDSRLKNHIIKQIAKIRSNPMMGKLMRNIRRDTRELYVKPFRLSYTYFINEKRIVILDLYHKDKQ